MAGGQPRDEGLQLASSLGPRQGAQIIAIDAKQVIDAHEGWIIGEHLFRHGLAPQPLLQRVEARRPSLCFWPALNLAAHQQFAVDHRLLIEGRDQFGESTVDLLAAAAVNPRLAGGMDDLDADAVPFPFGGEVGEVDILLLERVREHEGPKEGDVGKVGTRCPSLAPGEQRRIGRRDRVPQLLDIVDRHAERLCKSLFRQPRRHPDAHPAQSQFEQRITPVGVEPVEQCGDDRGRIAATGGGQRVDGFGDR